ncbi:retrovirus-related pol polyprotein from transposon TNT 1-94 [Tanacetum coccineum]
MFDLCKPLPLIMDRGRQVVHVDYFINNDLEYLRGGSSSMKYTTSTTKIKAAKYDIQGIEDIVPSLWSSVKKLSNLEKDVIFDLGVALWMFTRHKYNRNKLMHWDELYKFIDGKLTSVRFVLHDIASNLRMDYLPKRRWSSLDRKRSRIMIKVIDQQMLKRG